MPACPRQHEHRAPSRPTARMADAFLDADAIRAATFVRHVEIHDTLGSTNDRAAELARATRSNCRRLSSPGDQTAGRGRGTQQVVVRRRRADIQRAARLQVLRRQHQRTGRSSRSPPPSQSATRSSTNCDEIRRSQASASNGRTTSCSMAQGLRHPHRIARRRRARQGPAHHRHRHQRQQFVAIGATRNWPGSALRCATSPIGTTICNALLIRILNAIRERDQQLARNRPQLPDAWQRLCWLTRQTVRRTVQIDGRVYARVLTVMAIVVETALASKRVQRIIEV